MLILVIQSVTSNISHTMCYIFPLSTDGTLNSHNREFGCQRIHLSEIEPILSVLGATTPL